jgi:mRNA interferase MazF
VKRGDIVTCALAGDYGKPRPAVIVQSDLFNPTHASIVVCPVTSHIVNAPLFRIDLPCDNKTGLQKDSQMMVDKLTAVRADRIKSCIGSLSIKQRIELDKAVKLWLGL